MAVVLDGIVFGLQLALLGVGLTLVYGLGGILNLAHGQLVVVAAIGGSLLLGAGAPAALAVSGAVMVAGVAAWGLDRSVLRPVYAMPVRERVLVSLLVTIGVATALDGLLVTVHPFAALNLTVPGPALEMWGVPMRRGSLVASGVAVAALGALLVLLHRTRFGRAVRALIEDEQGARLCGVDPSRVRAVVFVLSGIAAGLFAVSQGMIAAVGATSGLRFTILALIVTVVGGLGRVGGTIVAGLLLGIVHAVASVHIGAFTTYVILLGVAMLAIVVRPDGLLGRPA